MTQTLDVYPNFFGSALVSTHVALPKVGKLTSIIANTVLLIPYEAHTMNFFTQVLNLVGSGAVAYVMARNIRDRQTRPNMLAGLQLAESGAVPYLEKLSQRAAEEGDSWLSDRLMRHAQDERRHGQIFAHALKQLNKQAMTPEALRQRSEQEPEDRRRSPFFAAYYEDYSREDLAPERVDWTVFLGSTYILELDASKDFARMALALPEDEPTTASLRKSILSVAQDEEGHAAYLREAMQRSMTYAEVEALTNEWRSRKVNAMLAMVGNLIQRNGQTQSLVQDGAPDGTVQAEAAQGSELAAA